MMGLAESSHFFYAIAIVLTALIITMGFGHCDQDPPYLVAYKACVAKATDVKDCEKLDHVKPVEGFKP